MGSWWNRRRENELRSSHGETANTTTYPASGLTYGDNTPTAASKVYIEGSLRLQRYFSLDGQLSVSSWKKKLPGALAREMVRNELSPSLDGRYEAYILPLFYNGRNTHVTVTTGRATLGSHEAAP